jgi:hypothetical protein
MREVKVQTVLPRELAKSLTGATQPGLVSPGGAIMLNAVAAARNRTPTRRTSCWSRCVCLLLQYLLQSCSRGGRRGTLYRDCVSRCVYFCSTYYKAVRVLRDWLVCCRVQPLYRPICTDRVPSNASCQAPRCTVSSAESPWQLVFAGLLSASCSPMQTKEVFQHAS